MDKDTAFKFAEEWIASWNARELDRILSHYEDDFQMSSSVITQITGEASGVLKLTDLRNSRGGSIARLSEAMITVGNNGDIVFAAACQTRRVQSDKLLATSVICLPEEVHGAG